MQRRRKALAGVGRKPLEEGKGESGRLAGARLSGPEQVASREDDRNGLGLDGGGFAVTLLRDGAQQLGQ